MCSISTADSVDLKPDLHFNCHHNFRVTHGIPIIAMRLGQITMAVAVQMLVDTVLMRHSPAEVAVPWLVELHQKSNLGGFWSIF